MNDARFNSGIPIPHLKTQPGTYLQGFANPLFSEDGPQLDDLDPTYTAASFDDGFWGVFQLEDLNGHPLLPTDYQDPIQLQDSLHTFDSFQPLAFNSDFYSQSNSQLSFQTRFAWDLDEFVAPVESHKTPFVDALLEETYHFSESQWSGVRDQKLQGVWSSYPPPSTESGSYSLERVPSLDRNSLAGSLSHENPAEIAAIYGASQWLQTPPIAWSENNSYTDLRGGQEMKSPMFESLHSSTQEPILDAFTGQTFVPVDGQSNTYISPNAENSFSHFNFRQENIPSEQSEINVPCWPPTRLDSEPGGSAVDVLHNFNTHSRGNSMAIVAAPTSSMKPRAQEGPWNCFVFEDGLGSQYTPPEARRKGVRNGRMTEHQRKLISDRRKQCNTCIRCRFTRVACDGDNPCGTCSHREQSKTLAYPCIKASFIYIIKSGTLNYISQRAINHFTLDESRRIKMFLPEAFDVNHLLSLLESRRQRFNIRARQASEPLYVLDLEQCYNFLDKIRKKSVPSSKGNLRTFIDDELVNNTDSWYACVKECDPTKNKTALLSKWNNMPSRASYDLVPLTAGSPSRPLDPLDAADAAEIVIAAQISRIVCRKLEIDGYAALQSEVNAIRSNSTYASRHNSVEKLAKILLSLRWRMSWWKLLGDGSNADDPFRDRFVERVEHLSKVLYFYYFVLRTRIGAWHDLGDLEGEMSSYPDAVSVFDDFPTVQSIEGFEEWLERGKQLIREANAERRFSQ